MKVISSVREFSGDDNHRSVKDSIGQRELACKEKILKYLNSFEADCAAGMSLRDEITGEYVDSGVSGYEDGQYYWDTREIYHFEKYNMELNEDFVEYVSRMDFE